MATTEEKIISASLLEFSEFGYDGARIDRIAAKAKINKAMIYYHYKSKEKLYEAVMMQNITRVSDLIKNSFPDGKATMDQLYSFISNLMNYFSNNVDPVLFKIILREFSSGGKYIRKLVFPNIIQPISKLVLENMINEINNNKLRDINPYYTTLLIFGGIIYTNLAKIVLQGTPFHEIIFNENFAQGFADNLTDILKNGIENK